MFSTWNGSKVIDIPLLDPDYSLDVEGILNAVTDRTRLIFLTSPNNPTGTHIPKQVLDQLLDQLPNHVVLVLDEVYYHFATAEDYTTAVPYVQKVIISLLLIVFLKLMAWQVCVLGMDIQQERSQTIFIRFANLF